MMQILAQTLSDCCLLKGDQIVGCLNHSQQHIACCQGIGDCIKALSKHWGLHQGTGDCTKALSKHWGLHQGTVKALGTASKPEILISMHATNKRVAPPKTS